MFQRQVEAVEKAMPCDESHTAFAFLKIKSFIKRQFYNKTVTKYNQILVAIYNKRKKTVYCILFDNGMITMV